MIVDEHQMELWWALIGNMGGHQLELWVGINWKYRWALIGIAGVH